MKHLKKRNKELILSDVEHKRVTAAYFCFIDEFYRGASIAMYHRIHFARLYRHSGAHRPSNTQQLAQRAQPASHII